MTADYRKLFVGGEWTPASGPDLPSINPYTREEWAVVGCGDASDVAAAIGAARGAAPGWGGTSASFRADLLSRFAEALEDDAERLAEIETRDNGKLFKENRNQIVFAAKIFRYFAHCAVQLTGETKLLDNTDALDYTTREPRGVVVLLAPWNSPIQTLSNKLAPALAAGNAVVIKPSEFTSASTLELGHIFEKVGFPPGSVNVVAGGVDTGQALTTDARVDMISFTGGIAAARSIAANAAANVIPLTMELGGKGANIVFADADLRRAVPGAVAGIFAAAGQTCVAGSRLLLHESIYDEVLQDVVDAAAKIRPGDPMDPLTQMGPMAHESHFHRVLGAIDRARSEGIDLVAGGGVPPGYDGQLFVEPTVFSHVALQSSLAQEEVFGPVLAVSSFADDDEAIAIANGTDYGLAAGLWTRDINRAHLVARRLDAGTVWVNTYRSSAAQAPFGGVKRSGYGRERGFEGLLEYTRVKNTMVDLSDVVRDPFVLGT